MKTEHILVIRFSALGDVAMTVPVIYSLARQYPHLRITVLSRPFARPFFDNLAPNIGFMGADVKKEYHGVKGLNTLYRRLTAKNFTAVADLHNVLRSNYLRMRFNFDRYHVAHIDKHREGKRELTAFNNKRLQQQPTSFQNYADVFARLGYPVKLSFKSIYPQGKPDFSTLPAAIGQKQAGQPWIGIAPFAAHEGKIYPLELMHRVIYIITGRHPSCRIFLFGGGKRENKLISDIEQKYPNAINASSLLHGIDNELKLMSHLDVMVSMDSANMHLASLAGTPVVSVWGATHPYAGFMGWGQDPADAVQIDLPCRPCSIYGNRPCLRGDYACLHNIPPEAIADRVDIVLKRRK